MKTIALLSCLIFSIPVWANNIIVNGTRFIYPGNEKEITVQLSNTADRPALAQSWLDNGDASATPDTITTPFIITPPISRVDARSGQTLRIRLANPSAMAAGKESLWWLNVLEIPPVVTSEKNEGSNILQLAIRSRFKFIYRPAGLGNRDTAPEKLVLTADAGGVQINNPTPFYITVTRISRNGAHALNKNTVMLAPLASQHVALSESVRASETLTLNNINDYGADVAVKLAVR